MCAILAAALLGTISCATVPTTSTSAADDKQALVLRAAVAVCQRNTLANSQMQLTHLSTEKINDKLVQETTVGAINSARVWAVNASLNSGLPTHYIHWFKVSLTADAWVFRRAMKRGETITEEDVEQRTVNISDPNNVVTQAPIGYLTNREISRNTLITNQTVRQAPLIAAQQTVMVHVKNGDLVIRTRATAISEARKVGDRLRVKINVSQQIVEATAEDKTNVFLD